VSSATQPAPWVGWLRRLGPPNTSRAWRAVAEADGAHECQLAVEAVRAGLSWVVAEWVVLRRGEHPSSALGRRMAG
jgi:hypothetical protein